MYFEKLTLILPKFLLHIVKFVWKIYIQEKADKRIHTIYVHLYFNGIRRGGWDVPVQSFLIKIKLLCF